MSMLDFEHATYVSRNPRMNHAISKFSQNELTLSPVAQIETQAFRNDVYKTLKQEEMNLGVVLSSLQKYWYVTAIISTVLMAGIVYKTAKEPRIYKSSVQIAIELKNTSTLADKLGATTGGGAGAEDRSTTLETIIQKLKTKTILKQALNTIPDPQLRPSVDTALQNLTIQTGQNTNILTITYTDTDPKRIVASLNALSKVYIDFGTQTKKARTNNSISFIDSQLPKSQQRLKTISPSVSIYRSTKFCQRTCRISPSNTRKFK
jgi:polysaccharide biosynthesis transport protein